MTKYLRFHDFAIDIWISVVWKKGRQGRRRWWLQNDACTVPGFDYRISSLAISTLHAKRGKEGTIDLKFLLSITFFPFPPPFPRLVHALYFQLTFLVTHSWTITRALFLQWKIEKSKLPFKNQRNIDYKYPLGQFQANFRTAKANRLITISISSLNFSLPPGLQKKKKIVPSKKKNNK